MGYLWEHTNPFQPVVVQNRFNSYVRGIEAHMYAMPFPNVEHSVVGELIQQRNRREDREDQLIETQKYREVLRHNRSLRNLDYLIEKYDGHPKMATDSELEKLTSAHYKYFMSGVTEEEHEHNKEEQQRNK